VAQVLADTSGVYALIDRKDRHHAKAIAALEKLSRRSLEPVLTNFVVAETHALLLSRLGGDAARRWLLTQTWRVEAVIEADEARAGEIIKRYTDKTFSYTDAASFAVMERLRIAAAFGFDPHFEQYGFSLIR
jgi:predicted nucleic acid-binding protein